MFFMLASNVGYLVSPSSLYAGRKDMVCLFMQRRAELQHQRRDRRNVIARKKEEEEEEEEEQ